MQKNTFIIVLASLLIGGIGGYIVTQNYTMPFMATNKSDNTVPAGMHRMPDGTLMSNGGDAEDMGMMHGMDHSMMMVSSEREFIEGMIPHHQEAVDTAKEVLERGGTTPEVIELVEAIIVAQEREIADMKQWYQDWYGEPYVDIGAYVPMMRELADLSGAELDRVFLEDMIMHHMGAIMMANSVTPYIEHDEIAELATMIRTTQAEEIRLMRSLLRDLN